MPLNHEFNAKGMRQGRGGCKEKNQGKSVVSYSCHEAGQYNRFKLPQTAAALWISWITVLVNYQSCVASLRKNPVNEQSFMGLQPAFACFFAADLLNLSL
ncbi:hypothetical protein ACQ3G6_10705 [Allorhizobium undicola]|uniref:hypothetical protein n=1 Tax=Allorhizobium undicola TaxID=78527 RepID=UPI003D34B72F